MKYKVFTAHYILSLPYKMLLDDVKSDMVLNENYIKDNKIYYSDESTLIENIIILAIKEEKLDTVKYYINNIDVNGYYSLHPNRITKVHVFGLTSTSRKKYKLVEYAIYSSIKDGITFSSDINYINTIITFLLDVGMDPNTILLENASLLQYACGRQNLELIQILCNKGANPNLSTPSCNNLIEYMFEAYFKNQNYSKYSDTIEYILTIPNIKVVITEEMFDYKDLAERLVLFCGNIKLKENNNILHKLIKKSSITFLTNIIDKSMDHKNTLGFTPIHNLLIGIVPIEKVALCIEKGFDMHTLDNDGNTYLMNYLNYQAMQGIKPDINIIKMLSCNINHVNNKGYNVLHFVTAPDLLEYFILQGVPIIDNLLDHHRKNKSIVDMLNDIVITEQVNNKSVHKDVRIDHVTFVLNQIKDIENNMKTMNSKQYFAIKKTLPIYHKYWKTCDVYHTYNTHVAALLYCCNNYINGDYHINNLALYLDNPVSFWQGLKKYASLMAVEWIIVEPKDNIISTNGLKRRINNVDKMKDAVKGTEVNYLEPCSKRSRTCM